MKYLFVLGFAVLFGASCTDIEKQGINYTKQDVVEFFAETRTLKQVIQRFGRPMYKSAYPDKVVYKFMPDESYVNRSEFAGFSIVVEKGIVVQHFITYRTFN